MIWSDGFSARLAQPSTFRMIIWPEASKAQKSMEAVSALGRTVWVLIRRLNSSCKRSIAFVVRKRFPLAWREAREGEQAISRFLQGVGDGSAFERPFTQEDLWFGLDLLAGGGVNHVGVVGRNLFVQPIRRVGEQVAMLVHGAALDRRVGPEGRERLVQTAAAIDDQQLRSPQTARDQIIELRRHPKIIASDHGPW